MTAAVIEHKRRQGGIALDGTISARRNAGSRHWNRQLPNVCKVDVRRAEHAGLFVVRGTRLGHGHVAVFLRAWRMHGVDDGLDVLVERQFRAQRSLHDGVVAAVFVRAP